MKALDKRIEKLEVVTKKRKKGDVVALQDIISDTHKELSNIGNKVNELIDVVNKLIVKK